MTDIARSDRPMRLPLIAWFLLCALLATDTTWILRVVARPSGWSNGLAADAALAALGIVVLLVLGFWNRIAARPPQTRTAFLLGAAVGAVFFFRVWGVAILDPTHVAWLMRDDWAQHYTGWELFRQSPWALPPGRTLNLFHPVGTSVMYTDSLPLFALPFKAIGALLPEQFQYIGMWFFVSCVLQGGIGALLLRRHLNDATQLLAATLLLVYAPIFILRAGHDTLTAHWLLLAALALYFRPPSRGETWAWLALCGVAALVHPYLAAMVGGVLVAACLRRTEVERVIDRSTAIKRLALCAVATLLAWWIVGVFTIPGSAGDGGVPFGRYSMNLLAPFDSAGYSRLLPALPRGDGQHEGFAWPGLGGWLVLLVAFIAVLARRGKPATPRMDWPLLLLCIGSFLFAASSVIRIGDVTLIDWPLQNPILGIFRSSGRFVWIAYYAVTVLALWRIAAAWPRAATLVMVAAIAVQMWEARPLHTYFARTRITVPPVETLKDPRWETLIDGRQHLVQLPPAYCGVAPGPYLPFALLAIEHHLTVNTAYLARWNTRKINRYCQSLTLATRNGTLDADAVYVLGESWRDRFHATHKDAHCETLDGYEACTLARPDAAEW